jgi:hypothetical protein
MLEDFSTSLFTRIAVYIGLFPVESTAFLSKAFMRFIFVFPALPVSLTPPEISP